MSTAHQAILIGSGISSLTCGILLAKAGWDVTVVERHEKVGGYLHCFERYGRRFDTGAHYSGALAPGDPFHALLTHLGAWRDDLFVPLAADGFDVLRFPDFEIRVPQGYAAFERVLVDAFPRDAAGIRAFLATIRDTAASFSTYNFARVDQDDDKIGPLLAMPLAAVVERLVTDTRLRCVLYAHCALHGVAPDDVSLGMHALLLDSLLRGAYGFKRGGEALAAALVRRIEDFGGRVLTSAGVRELTSDGRRVTGVVLDDGRVLAAPIVISGIHPKATFRLLSGFVPRPAFAERLAGIEETVSFVGAYGLTDAGAFAADRNYYYFDTEDPAAFAQLSPKSATLPRAAFVCRADRDDAPRAGATAAPISVHAPVAFADFAAWSPTGRKPRAYHLKKREAAAGVIAFVDGYVPGFQASFGRFDVSTPLSNLRFNGSEQGSAYGLYHAIRNTGPRALGPRTHVENLLLTGQNALFPGLLGAAISGLRTAGNLIGIKNIIKELSPLVRPLEDL